MASRMILRGLATDASQVRNAAAGSSGGQIALRNATQKSLAFSPGLTQTVPRVLSLHRDMLRAVPWVKRAYSLQMSEAVRGRPARTGAGPPADPRPHPHNPRGVQKIRSLVTAAFREKQNTSDLAQINRLIVIGRMELEETLMLWKSNCHLEDWCEKQNAAVNLVEKPKSFLEKFHAGDV